MSASSHIPNTTCEIVIFQVGETYCGITIDNVQEINKNMEITTVYSAPEYVRGVINLRGQIVTIVDMRKKFHMEPSEISKRMNNVVVNSKGEQIGLLVDNVEDIIPANQDEILPSPPHMNDAMGKYFTGVYKLEEDLVAILDMDKLLSKDA
ncbi:MAG: chemotaxis protein CheW [Deltaproteobacteria bacterium]|nr:chemotaxis protein CheW [Deltaproteobacteria bacterium]